MTFSLDLGKAGRQQSQYLPCAYRRKSTERKENIYIMVFVDLEKAYDRVPRYLMWWSLRNTGIPEPYVAIIQDMDQDTQTRVKTRCDSTEYFDIEVGLHQWYALSPLLFILVMYVLASEVGTHPPWGSLFADYLALFAESSVEVEEGLEKSAGRKRTKNKQGENQVHEALKLPR